MTRHATVCPHDCPSTCALEVEVLPGNRIGAVHGAEANTYTAGIICAKVARYAERIHHPDRLTHPLLRTGPKSAAGQFRRISWDEAIARIADNFLTLENKHGPESIWPHYFAGTMGLVQRDGINRLRHVKKYSRMHATICTPVCEAGWVAGTGLQRGVDPREMALSDLIIVWGGNPVATQVNVMTHIARARKQRGARLIVVDPYRTGTAAVADWHLPIRPGTDGALACAVMHVAFRDGHADRDYLNQYTDFPPDLEAHLATRSPAWAAAITGLPEADIEAFATEYCRTQRAFLRLGYGFARGRNGPANMHAVSCLPAVTGKWQYEGAGALWSNRGMYGWNKTLIEGLDHLDPTIRVLDQSRIGAVLTGNRNDLGTGPEIHALFIQNMNPVAVCPNTNLVRSGFAREDLFTVVHEQFMTETAAMADIVLPATMFLEHDDLYQAGGHSHVQIGPKLIDPSGECRSNHATLAALAAALGAEHPGFAMTEMEMIDATLRASGYPGAEHVLRERWIDAMPDFQESHFLNGFKTPDQKFHFAPDWRRVGQDTARMPRLPDHVPIHDAASPTTPFRMVTAPARQFLNTSFTEMASSRKREGRPTALIHPADAAAQGITDGALIRLGNALGEVILHAKLFDGLQPGVLVVESVWPNAAFIGGIGINALTSDDPAPPNGGAVFHDTAVWLRAEAQQMAAE